MGEHDLSLATKKTETVLLTRHRIAIQVEMKVETDDIATNNVVNYIRLHLDCKTAYFGLRVLCGKVANVISHIDGLKANVAVCMRDLR